MMVVGVWDVRRVGIVRSFRIAADEYIFIVMILVMTKAQKIIYINAKYSKCRRPYNTNTTHLYYIQVLTGTYHAPFISFWGS